MNNKLKLSVFSVFFILFSCILCFSCSDDEKISQTPASDADLAMAKKILRDSIVLNATAMQGTVNKTLLDSGCPLKYFFSWRGDSLNVQLRGFTVGQMPVTIWFSVNCKIMQLNSWEKQEYTDKGWIKFQGTDGVVNYTGNTAEYTNGSGGGGTVEGYFNANSKQIEFVTNFNVMNMSSDVFQQTIDTSRMANYEQEFKDYEAALAQYKKDHGLN
ncbi:DUF4903 domain-containing protein [Prevotella cerevisiae]|uniref:DUF4903 domain-containing protein n=1 Tax=Segatella cerevisiae TaxID=2053716 RepID=A0ABT1BTJ6_9BACT|nr:DUF4903 family protein [Segatella cerevisiae]MCO6024397.1 DUF4903 domain-containing protein [Segatella cerevisiae]